MNRKRHVFRLTVPLLSKLETLFPAQLRTRSTFIRESIDAFLRKSKRDLDRRPHRKGHYGDYKTMCVMLSNDQVEAIKAVYGDKAVSVVIEQAVKEGLRNYRLVKDLQA